MSHDLACYDDFLGKGGPDMQRIAAHRKSETQWMVDIAKEHGHKVGLSFNILSQMQALGIVKKVIANGGRVAAQTLARAQGFLFAFGARMHPFTTSQTFKKVAQQHPAVGDRLDLLARLRDPEARSAIMRETTEFFDQKKKRDQAQFQLFNLFPLDGIFKWTPAYEPSPEDSLAAIAAREGRAPLEVAYDVLVGGGILWRPFAGWDGSYESTRELLESGVCVPGFADAGAHGTIFQDSCVASWMLSHFVRDRTRGPRMSLERVVKLNTHDIASFFGMDDRGVIAPGKKADLNIIDFEKLKIARPHMANDLPLGHFRWLQDVEGYHLTLVSGRATYRHGGPTGELPGRLVRNPRRDASAWRGVAAEVSGPFDSGVLEPGAADDGDSQTRALDGAGTMGASAAARVMRSVDEEAGEGPQSRL